MLRKYGFYGALATVISLALPAVAATTSTDIDINVTHASGDCLNGPKVVTDKSIYGPGETITTSTMCGTGNPADWVYIRAHYNGQSSLQPEYLTSLGVNTTSATVTLKAPNIVADRDIPYDVQWDANNSYNQIATSPPFTVKRAASPPVPAATLPAALSADPFVPDHVMTVCASGCDSKDLGSAVNVANTNHWDKVQVKISAGEYEFPTATLPAAYPLHMWIKGISADGKTYPHIFGFTEHSSSMIGNNDWHYTTEGGSFTIDNVEFGPWNYWGLVQIDGSSWTLRNVYVRDASEGLITGNTQDFTLNIYNSVFARNGGGDGPEHDVYIGGGNRGNTVNVVNSVFEQPVLGHAFKERAKTFSATCSMFVVNEDDFYLGSETMDMDSGQPNLKNILSVNSGGAPVGHTNNSSWDNVRYGVDNEEDISPFLPMVSGSIFVADQPNSAHWFVSLGRPLTTHVTWDHNTFVWPDDSSRKPGTGGTLSEDSTGAIDSFHTGNTNDVTLDATNKIFTSRAAAGLPAVGTYPKGWRDYLPLMPAACTDPIGLVKIPAN